MESNKAYTLYGFIEYLPVELGFVTPVFRRGEAFYIQIASDQHTIDSFDALPENNKTIIRYSPDVHLIKEEHDNCIFAFKTEEGVIYNEGDNLARLMFNSTFPKTMGKYFEENIASFINECSSLTAQNQAENLPTKNVIARDGVELIFAIDESKAVRFLLQTILHKQFTIITAPDSISLAYRLRVGAIPRLIITDLSDESGARVFNILETNNLLGEVPIIVLSQFERSKNKFIGRYAPYIKAYLPKPFNPIELTGIVSDLIDAPKYEYGLA